MTQTVALIKIRLRKFCFYNMGLNNILLMPAKKDFSRVISKKRSFACNVDI